MNDSHWSWKHNTDPKWLTPEPMAYYLAERWLELDYLTVLDHGCGLGRHSVFMSKAGFVVTAFDRSETALEATATLAAREGAALRTVAGDMTSVPLPDAAFDAAICYNVIYHGQLDEARQAAKELARLIRPGGELYITMCSKSSPKFTQAQEVMEDGCTVMASEYESGNSVAHCYLSYEEMAELFEDFEFSRQPLDRLEYENGELSNAHWVLLLKRK